MIQTENKPTLLNTIAVIHPDCGGWVLINVLSDEEIETGIMEDSKLAARIKNFKANGFAVKRISADAVRQGGNLDSCRCVGKKHKVKQINIF